MVRAVAKRRGDLVKENLAKSEAVKLASKKIEVCVSIFHYFVRLFKSTWSA